MGSTTTPNQGGDAMVSRKDIESALPEIQWISDVKLRHQVIDIWEAAVKQGGWTSLDQIPFTLLFENSGKLTEHTRRVTQLCKSVADTRKETLNMDYLIAGALLHDVGKVVEYTLVNGKPVKSDYGKRFRHPVSGTKLAWQHGLPDDIALIIYAHSHEGDNCERTPESYIVHHCDFIDFHIKKSLVKE